ncbi:MAG: 2-C-methyl-D-erythritol 2,4-cyclodiphosphate synthase [Candidatus Omnitrophota bacterium]
MRIGIGYDIHRLTRGRKMILGGVEIDFERGPEGHSDGDVLIHAVCDAILGALGKGDIGIHFPDTDLKYKGIAGSKLLLKVRDILEQERFCVNNIDCVIVLEKPEIKLYREKIIARISNVLGIPKKTVSIKAKTAEGLGSIGTGEAVSAYVVALLVANTKKL